jgi:hypothetical protein
MAFETIKARIALLLNDVQNRPQDAHELHQQLLGQIGELRGTGMPVPDDLAELERRLEAAFAEELRPGAPPPPGQS